MRIGFTTRIHTKAASKLWLGMASKRSAFCKTCDAEREAVDQEQITLRNGRPAVHARCAVCGSHLYWLGRLTTDFAPPPLEQSRRTPTPMAEELAQPQRCDYEGCDAAAEWEILVASGGGEFRVVGTPCESHQWERMTQIRAPLDVGGADAIAIRSIGPVR
jgi:hypothetical protein